MQIPFDASPSPGMHKLTKPSVKITEVSGKAAICAYLNVSPDVATTSSFAGASRTARDRHACARRAAHPRLHVWMR